MVRWVLTPNREKEKPRLAFFLLAGDKKGEGETCIVTIWGERQVRVDRWH